MNDPYYSICDFDEQYLIQRAVNYLLTNEFNTIKNIVNSQKGSYWNFVEFSFLDLLNFDQLLGNLLLSCPKQVESIFHRALLQAQEAAYEENVIDNYLGNDIECIPNERIVIRWSHLPINPEIYKANLPKSSDTNRFIAVTGTVVRVNSPKFIEWEFAYECAKCGGIFIETADIETFELRPHFIQCKAQNAGPKCNSKHFTRISAASSSNSRDYQEIKLQERVHQLLPGALPRSIMCILLDDLAGMCHAGDDVTISGIVTRRWGSLVPGQKPEIELILLANNIVINNEKRGGFGANEEQINEFESFWKKNRHTPLRARNQIIGSICPQVYGLYIVKLAIAVVLAGGVPLIRENSKTRGESHLLMIGDPGTGKSQILKYAAKLATRSVLTTEIGSTSAGLTATAVKDVGGEWVLEAGALVLADGGVCCIDEFSSIKHEDQTAIHEAMEQQSIHIAKAGLVCSLHTRCSLLAATNPRGKYDINEQVSMNVSIGAPLLSRFDLVLVMLDEPDDKWDKTVSGFILKERMQKSSSMEVISNMDDDGENSCHRENFWPIEKLQAYFSWIKATFFPEVSLECQQILKRYYHKQRQSDNKDAARTTFRMLESLIRLAQGHAKLINRNVCTVQDGIFAVFLMETSMSGNFIGGNGYCINTARSFFSEDPDMEYVQLENKILKELDFLHFAGNGGNGDD